MDKEKFTTSLEAITAILNESTPLFANYGYSGVSIRQIANAVGVSIATIYYYFPDKKTYTLKVLSMHFQTKQRL